MKMNIEHEQRETREFWAVTDTGVKLVNGYSCAPMNPQTWWCPGVGLSMTEGHHLFQTEKGALQKAIAETRGELATLGTRLVTLEDRLRRLP